MSNGQFWQALKKLDDADKSTSVPIIRTTYIAGLVDGAITTQSETADSHPAAISLLALNVVFTRSKIAGFLDYFYKNPDNLRIPIPWALGIISMQANKTSDYAKIEAKTLAAKRAAVGDCQPSPEQ
jgi:hypothetical protein